MKQQSGNLHPFKNKIFTCEDLCLCTDMQMKKRFSLESSTEMENHVKNNIFHTQDLCLRTDLRCAGKQRRNGEFYGKKFKLGSSWNWCDRK